MAASGVSACELIQSQALNANLNPQAMFLGRVFRFFNENLNMPDKRPLISALVLASRPVMESVGVLCDGARPRASLSRAAQNGSRQFWLKRSRVPRMASLPLSVAGVRCEAELGARPGPAPGSARGPLASNRP